MILGIYDATGTGGGPKNLLATTAAFTPVVGWNTKPVTVQKSLSAGTYWLAYSPNDNNLAFVKQMTGKATWYTLTTFGTLPNPYATAGANAGGDTVHWSFYATLVTVPTITIGDKNIEATADNVNMNVLIGQQVTLSQAATLNSLTTYIKLASGNMRLGVYNNNGSAPGALLASTLSFVTATGWTTHAVTTPVLLQPGTYWLTFLTDNATVTNAKQVTSGVVKYITLPAYGVMPATFPTGLSTQTQTYSFYATLTPTVAPSTKFKIGNKVIATNSLNVRATPGGTLLGAKPLNTIGTVVGGPVRATLIGTTAQFNYWNLTFATSPNGWVGEDNLKLAPLTTPTPTPTPNATPTLTPTPTPAPVPTPLPTPTPSPTPTPIQSPTPTPTVSLAWNLNTATTSPNTNAVGYRLHTGSVSGSYTQTTELGSTAAVTVPIPNHGSKYFFVVTAYNIAGIESVASNEVTITSP